MTELIATLIALLASVFGVVDTNETDTNEFDYTTLQPCMTDEAESAFDCYWNAETRGNGQGNSFWINVDVDKDGNVINTTVHEIN